VPNHRNRTACLRGCSALTGFTGARVRPIPSTTRRILRDDTIARLTCPFPLWWLSGSLRAVLVSGQLLHAEATVLHGVIRDHVEDSCAFLTFGMLAHGCVRVRCERYAFKHLADLPDALVQDRREMRWFSVI
jgi:hypothetical protein